MKRAVVIRMGDAQMAGAIADGMSRAMARQMKQQDEVLRKTRKRIMRMDLHGDRDARYWADKCFEAEMKYGESMFNPTIRERIADRWAYIYAVVVGIFEEIRRARA